MVWLHGCFVFNEHAQALNNSCLEGRQGIDGHVNDKKFKASAHRKRILIMIFKVN